MRPYYYPGTPNFSEETEARPGTSEKRQMRLERRSERVEMRRGTDGDEKFELFDMMLGLRTLGMREQRERAKKEKKRVNEATVSEWRATVNQAGKTGDSECISSEGENEN